MKIQHTSEELTPCTIGTATHFFEHMTPEDKMGHKIETDKTFYRCSKCNKIVISDLTTIKMTKIFSANVTIGKDNEHPVIVKQISVKRLPIRQLANDKFFVSVLISACGQKRWSEFKVNSKTGIPELRIEWLKYLSEIVNEPKIGHDE